LFASEIDKNHLIFTNFAVLEDERPAKPLSCTPVCKHDIEELTQSAFPFYGLLSLSIQHYSLLSPDTIAGKPISSLKERLSFSGHYST